MADELTHQLEDQTSYASLGFEERLGLMVDAEWNRRQSNKLTRYIKIADFSIQAQKLKVLNIMRIVSLIKLKLYAM